MNWDPAVETWDAFDNGKVIGRFYLDMHPRPGKFSHAAMFPALDGVAADSCRRRFSIVRFPPTHGGRRGLMDYDVW